jgi:hypothetical protein
MPKASFIMKQPEIVPYTKAPSFIPSHVPALVTNWNLSIHASSQRGDFNLQVVFYKLQGFHP